MNSEFAINGALTVIGVCLLVAGIIGIIRGRKARPVIWSWIAASAGATMLAVVLVTTSVGPAVGGPGPKPSSQSAPIIDNRAAITGEVTAITKLSTEYPWQLEIKVRSIGDVDNLPNPITGREGKTIAFQTDANAANLSVGQLITGTVRLTGQPGATILYISDISA